MPRRGVLGGLCLAFFTDTFAYAVVTPFLPRFLTTHFQADPVDTGLVFAAFGVGACLSAPLWARLLLRASAPRTLLVAGGVGLAASTAFLLPAALPLPAILLGRAVMGAASMGTCSAGLVLVAQAYPPDAIGRVSGWTQAAMSAGLLLSPAVGGWLYRHWGLHAPFWFTVLLYGSTLGLLATLVLGDPTLKPSDNDTSKLLSVHEVPRASSAVDLNSENSLQAIMGDCRQAIHRGVYLELFIVGSAVAVLASTTAGVESALPDFLHITLDLDTDHTGFLLALVSLVYAMSSVPAGHLCDRWGPQAALPAGALLCAASLPPLGAAAALQCPAWPTRLCVQVAACAVFGATQAGLAVSLFPALLGLLTRAGATHAPILASLLMNFLFAAGLTVGPPLAGALVHARGFPTALLGLAAPLLLVAALAARGAHRTAAPGGPPPPRTAPPPVALTPAAGVLTP